MSTEPRSVRLQAEIASTVSGGAMPSVGFKVQPSGKTGKALVAQTALQKARGLRGGPMTNHDAMLFPSGADHLTPMTMRGVNRNLEVAWLDETGAHLGHSALLANQDPVAPPGPYRHALEFEEGGLARFGLQADGSRVIFDDEGGDPAIVVPHVDPTGGWMP